MAKFSNLAKGRRARQRGVPFFTLSGDKLSVDIGVLDGAQHGDVLKYAAEFAAGRKAQAKDGDPLFEFGKDIQTVALGVLDPESPEEAPELFFVSAEEVLHNLDRDRIAILAAQQRSFQSATSPLQKAMNNDEFFLHVAALAETEEEHDSPFALWAPSMRWSFERTMAKLLIARASEDSPPPKSSSTSSNEEEPTLSLKH